ncbi:MAG TPA: ABC transporter permease subunit [Solirubrobacteraceae bacterium]|jgi:hypothetical protein|nr:ABC transporter permease subunit [Solirubrobacteraceae bacterium]
MTWVAWRQFRTPALVTLGLFVAFALLVLLTGLHLRDVYNSVGGAHCDARGGCTAVAGHDKALAQVLQPALLVLPALLGMFWGAPLLARELESGTYRLAWTQSVTRRRWLLVKVALGGAAALAVAGLASWLVSWWYAPLDHLNRISLEPTHFSERGIVAIGYAGFAFALGVAAGALLRRTLPAMIATLLGFVATRLAVTYLVRPHLLAARHALLPLTFGQGVGLLAGPEGITIYAGAPTIPNAWVLSTKLVDHAHHTLGSSQLHDLLARTCPTIAGPDAQYGKGPGFGGSAFESCLHAVSRHVQLLVAYQPPSHYWPLQALETAIFLAAAAALIGATAWRLGRRPAPRPAVGESSQRAERPDAASEPGAEIDAPLVLLPDERRRADEGS